MDIRPKVKEMGLLHTFVFASLMLAHDPLPLEENIPLDHPAIRYEEAAPDNAVSRLINDWNKGKRLLKWQPDGFSYLISLLKELNVPVDSQTLVFSRTSLQATLISPWNPRAIFFNDDVSIGWIPDAPRIEITAIDPKLGPVFYTLDTHKQDKQRILRQDSCLSCHQGAATSGVPGLFISSVFPNGMGIPSRRGSVLTDYRTPFAERWGGWYIHAKKGQQSDRSNAFALNPSAPDQLNQPANGMGIQNQTELPLRIEKKMLVSPMSDIVALMTLEHQTSATNLLTRLHWESRMGNNTEARVKDLVDVFFFLGEAPITEPVEGVSTFTQTFPKRGPHDAKGRSLRDFDLQTRIFRYPLSYMIYSAQFDALPSREKAAVADRIIQVLQSEEDPAHYPHLKKDIRIAILEILRETKPDLFSQAK